MPSGSVESEHVLGAKTLPQWMLRNERFELAHCGAVAAERELGFEPSLERVQTKVLEMGAFRLCERLGCELGERRPAPERQRLAEPVFGPPIASPASSAARASVKAVTKRLRSSCSGSRTRAYPGGRVCRVPGGSSLRRCET